jgi:FtsZ-binding cell division protein ZapB
MYVILEKLIEEREAKSQIIKVLQDEINYIKSTDESFENTGLTLDELKKIRQALADEINNVRDEHKKFDMVEAYQGLDTFIRYIEN